MNIEFQNTSDDFKGQDLSHKGLNSDQININQSSEDLGPGDRIINLGKRQRKTTTGSLSTDSGVSQQAPPKRRAEKGSNKKGPNTKVKASKLNDDSHYINNNENTLSEDEDDVDDLMDGSGSNDQRDNTCRLIQNRKSAMKCRLKKKAEFEKLKEDFIHLKEQKIILNQQYQQAMMLYEDKVKENQQLKEKLDSIQQIQTAMLAYVLSQNHIQQISASGSRSKDTQSPTIGSTSAPTQQQQTSVIAGLPNFLMQLMGNPFGSIMPQNRQSPLSDGGILAQLLGGLPQAAQFNALTSQVQNISNSPSIFGSSANSSVTIPDIKASLPTLNQKLDYQGTAPKQMSEQDFNMAQRMIFPFGNPSATLMQQAASNSNFSHLYSNNDLVHAHQANNSLFRNSAANPIDVLNGQQQASNGSEGSNQQQNTRVCKPTVVAQQTPRQNSAQPQNTIRILGFTPPSQQQQMGNSAQRGAYQ